MWKIQTSLGCVKVMEGPLKSAAAGNESPKKTKKQRSRKIFKDGIEDKWPTYDEDFWVQVFLGSCASILENTEG